MIKEFLKKRKERRERKEFVAGYKEGAYWCVKTHNTDMVETNIRQSQNFGCHPKYTEGLYHAMADYLEGIEVHK